MYIKETRKCPVCGKENEYEAYTEIEWGNVEQHYYCDRCTYFLDQSYSHPYSGICTDCPEEYVEIAKEQGLEFFPPEAIP